MKPGLIFLLRILAILSALAMLTAYVCFRQKIGPFAKKELLVEFPETPTNPTGFTSTKSIANLIPPDSESTLNRVDNQAQGFFFTGMDNDWDARPPNIMGSTKLGPVLATSPTHHFEELETVDTLDDLIEKASNGELVTVEEVEKPTIFISTKRIEMPVFNVKKANDESPEGEGKKTEPDEITIMGSTKDFVPVIPAPKFLKPKK